MLCRTDATLQALHRTSLSNFVSSTGVDPQLPPFAVIPIQN